MARVIKTIRTRKYYYDQTSKRVSGKVVTTSVYVGPVTPRQRLGKRIMDFIEDNLKSDPAGRVWDMALEQETARAALEKEKSEAFAAKMKEEFQMDLKTYTEPVDKEAQKETPEISNISPG